MVGWRLKWAIKQFCSIENYRNQKAALKRPSVYYMAIVLKLVPRLYNRTIRFELVDGTHFGVDKFMSIYIYQEIFIEKCYDDFLEGDGGLVIIDVGANIGLFALRAMGLRPGSQIICFEPYPPNYQLLKKHLQANYGNCIEAVNMGVGSSSRNVKLYVHPKNTGGHSIVQGVHADTSRSVEIELTDLGSALQRTKRGRCDLLKLDCEGAEYEIIKSITPELAEKIAKIVFEPSPGLYSCTTLVDHLEGVGYELVQRKGLYFATYRPERNAGGTPVVPGM